MDAMVMGNFSKSKFEALVNFCIDSLKLDVLVYINVVVDVISWVVIVEATNLKLEKLRGCFLEIKTTKGDSSSLLWLSFSSWGECCKPSFLFFPPHSQKTK
jgi:hypothetical protein